MNNKIKFLIKIFIIIGAFFVFQKIVFFLFERNFISLRDQRLCEHTEKVKQKKLRGTVIRVFRNERSHLDETIEYVINGDTLMDNLLILEQSYVFEKIRPGDYIEKNEGNLCLKIKRGEEDILLKLDYDCNK